jgi:hypothetical protein
MRSSILKGITLVVLAAFAGCGGSTDEGKNGNGVTTGGGGSGGSPGGSGGVAGVAGVGGSSGYGGYTCFAAGTPIATPSGDVPIDRLNVGDLVLAYDEVTRAVVPRPVVRTFAHADQQPGHLRLEDGRVLEVTDNHPVYLPERGTYADAGTVANETRLLVLNGTTTTSGIADGFLPDPSVSLQTVYNIEVAEHHNYFAGSVLVHNKSGGAPPCTPEKKSIIATDACETSTECLDPDPATFEDIDAGSDADAGGDDGGMGGSQELQRWFCSQPDANQTYLVAFDLSSPEPYEDYISLTSSPSFPQGTGGAANCEGFELGQIWTWHEADAATTDWTTLCTEIPGATLNQHLAARVQATGAKLRNIRFVKSCDCHLEQKQWNSCSQSYGGFAGASSCL